MKERKWSDGEERDGRGKYEYEVRTGDGEE
jgi:hypothetical protein